MELVNIESEKYFRWKSHHYGDGIGKIDWKLKPKMSMQSFNMMGSIVLRGTSGNNKIYP